jgi:hypothetical protein
MCPEGYLKKLLGPSRTIKAQRASFQNSDYYAKEILLRKKDTWRIVIKLKTKVCNFNV